MKAIVNTREVEIDLPLDEFRDLLKFHLANHDDHPLIETTTAGGAEIIIPAMAVDYAVAHEV